MRFREWVIWRGVVMSFDLSTIQCVVSQSQIEDLGENWEYFLDDFQVQSFYILTAAQSF